MTDHSSSELETGQRIISTIRSEMRYPHLASWLATRIGGRRTRVYDWKAYLIEDYMFVDFPPGALVLDVGCGYGRQLQELQSHGCRSFGVEIGWEILRKCRSLGLTVLQGSGEQLPVKCASVDGVICKVAIPYTHEASVLGEISRVLKAGSVGHVCYHGAGYYLRYLLCAPSWKFRFYGLRTLVNTWLYVSTGWRLPGFLGDTIYQSRRRLAKYYRRYELRLVQEPPARSLWGFPVFIYNTVQKDSLSRREPRRTIVSTK